VEQHDIQGSQGALTVAFETLSNKHKIKTQKHLRKPEKSAHMDHLCARARASTILQ